VFISSTFSDMQAERDHLRNFVFPEIEERLRAARVHLEWVDLRIGVAADTARSEAEREVQILKVCLEEIKRCRPFLIVLLGDRYGWIPPSDRLVAAGAEMGFLAQPGCSVTELEIDFGVLSDEAQLRRSLVFFRDPLPYEEMPEAVTAQYSDARAGFAEAAARLESLKARIASSYPERVSTYRAGWNSARCEVNDLAAFGRAVADGLLATLQVEIAEAGIADEPENPEQAVLDDFVEETARDFLGRKDILSVLEAFAYSPASPETWGLCVSGEPGSGKSALFSVFCRRLADSGALVLAHSAAAGPEATSVDGMLSRWIGALAAVLGVTVESNLDASSAALEATFNSLLARAARVQRIIVLVDALDQFEATPRARHLTWLPRSWPENVRFIATTVPGEACQSLADRNVQLLPLRPLDAVEAATIIEGVCARYHRRFEPDLIETVFTAGGAARGSPLWLVLAADNLNLVDAGDFARAHTTFAGPPIDQLRALMRSKAEALPASVSGLYEASFNEAEMLFGRAATDSFLWLIGLSRGGWRDSDFRILMPSLSSEPWDALRFATLRRLFRGQIRRRGPTGRLDFDHAQMRVALQQRGALRRIDERRVHTAIADHLLALPAGDPLRETETMIHLLAAADFARAAHYYGDDLTDGELLSASCTLVDLALEPARASATPGIERLLQLLSAGADTAYEELAAQRLLHFVLRLGLRLRAPLETQKILTEALVAYFGSFQPRDQAEGKRFDAQRSAAHDQLGDVLFEMGDLAGAEASYRESIALGQRSTGEFRKEEERRDRSVALNKLGKTQAAHGDFVAAKRTHGESLALIKAVAAREPDNTEWARDLAISQGGMASVLYSLEDYAGAEVACRACLAILTTLAARNPDDRDHQRDLASGQMSLGGALVARGKLAAAEDAYVAALAINERSVAIEPENPTWHLDLAQAHRAVGQIRMRQGNLTGATEAFRRAVAAIEMVVAADPNNVAARRTLAEAQTQLGELFASRDDLNSALTWHEAALAVSEETARQAPDFGENWMSLALRHLELGYVQQRRKDGIESERHYRATRSIVQSWSAREPHREGWGSIELNLDIRLCELEISLGRFKAAEMALEAFVAQSAVLAARSVAGFEYYQAFGCKLTGDIRRAQSRLPEAEDAYRAGVVHGRRSTELESADVRYRTPLVQCLVMLQKIQAARADFAGVKETGNILRGVLAAWGEKVTN